MTTQKYFATRGQLGWTEPQNVEDMGGCWKFIPDPAKPGESDAQNRPTQSLDAYAAAHQKEKGYPPLIVGRAYGFTGGTAMLFECAADRQNVLMKIGDSPFFTAYTKDLTWKKEAAE